MQGECFILKHTRGTRAIFMKIKVFIKCIALARVPLHVFTHVRNDRIDFAAGKMERVRVRVGDKIIMEARTPLSRLGVWYITPQIPQSIKIPKPC
jgi:hypothetical protein